jgi:CspA family cold shock protein
MSKPDEAPRLTGTVKWFNQNKGSGFIAIDDYRDIFMHISQWVHERDPEKGDKVTFVEDKGRDGRPYARQIVVVKELGD